MIENRIKDSIKRQEIIDKLPAKRVLAKEFGVSYVTMRKAIENLVRQNILYKIPARGTYVEHPKGLERIMTNIRFLFKKYGHVIFINARKGCD
jgi:DNA-binding GntR family transcriptional regulator